MKIFLWELLTLQRCSSEDVIGLLFHGHSQKTAAYVAFEVFLLVVDQTEEFKAEFDRF